MIFSAHPDDHISCAGTALFLQERGFEIVEVIFTAGESGGNRLEKGKTSAKKLKEIRSAEFSNASKLLGTEKVYGLNQPDGNVTRSPELISRLIEIIRTERPTIAISENPNDYHYDHRQVGQIATEALDKAGWGILPELGEKYKTPVGLYMGSLIQNERSDVLVDITKFWEKKERILSMYGSQAGDMFFQLNESLGKYFGFYMRTKYAESFETMKNYPVRLNDLF